MSILPWSKIPIFLQLSKVIKKMLEYKMYEEAQKTALMLSLG